MTSSPKVRAVVRPLESADDFRAALKLQRLTWGESFSDLVPPHVMKVAQRIGGVASGAFGEAGELLGFVFGITGVQDGSPVHWSDMLAVRPEAQGRGIGRLLKEHQRELLRARGVGEIQWSYDPLVARNAHLNLARLGACVTEYVVDMYSDSDSPLHRGFGTDRFIVSWRTDGTAQPRRSGPIDAAPVMNTGADGRPTAEPHLPDHSPLLRVEIPADIHAVLEDDVAEAVSWRASTRQAFLTALRAGYEVLTFVRDGGTGRSYYLLGAPESR
jgi:predicted GNAT superfamily acetyltransferase